jgi:phosphonate transport system substrate-binding protein
MEALVLGAVAYDPKVVTIWEGFAAWMQRRGLELDFVLYGTYERLVESLLAGHVHVAWNSPLAWLEAERAARRRGQGAKAVAMRNTDRDLTSVIVVRSGGPATVAELRGRRIAVGASDSPQATLIPLGMLAGAGLDPQRELEVVRFEVAPGKHGDHVGGERAAARALAGGEVDAACMIDANQLLFAHEGVFMPGSTRVLAQTLPYDHCNMTVLESGPRELVRRFVELLLGMSYDDPEARPLLDLEGLRRWLPGRTQGYAQLESAVDRFGTLNPWLERL